LHPRPDDALPVHGYRSAAREGAVWQSVDASLRTPLEVGQLEPRDTELR
jgi:hypothetical protein